MKMEDGEIKEALTVQSVCVCISVCGRMCACICVLEGGESKSEIERGRERAREREIMLEAKGGNECMKLRGEKKKKKTETGSARCTPTYCFNIVLLHTFITALFSCPSPSTFSSFNCFDTGAYLQGRFS